MAFNILVALAPSDETTRILKATGALVLLPQLHKEIGVQQTVPTLAGERAPAAAFHHWVLRGIELGIHKETVRPSLAKVQEAQTILAEMPEHIAESKFEEITHALQQLRERIGNTITVVRSNAYGHALITYDRSKKKRPTRPPRRGTEPRPAFCRQISRQKDGTCPGPAAPDSELTATRSRSPLPLMRACASPKRKAAFFVCIEQRQEPSAPAGPMAP